MNYYKRILFFMSLVFIFTQCKKDDDSTPLFVGKTNQDIPVETPTEESENTLSSTSASKLITRLSKAPQSKTITSYDDLPLKGEQNTEVWIYPYQLQTTNNESVDFPIDIEILEVYSVSEMIFNNVPTTSNGSLLVSGGEFKLTASKNGSDLSLSSSISVNVPTTSPDNNMELFFGNEQTDGTVNWFPAPVDSIKFDSSTVNSLYTSPSFYQIQTTNLGWINCDYFYRSTGSKSTISFESADESISISYIKKYIYFPSINSLANVYGSTFEVDNNIEAYFIGISADENETPYLFISDKVNVNGATTISIDLKETTESQLQIDLDNLGI